MADAEANITKTKSKMKLPALIKVMPLAAFTLCIMASSSYADDNDGHRRNKRNHHRGSNGVNIGLVIPRVTVDLYPRQERTVIIEHNRRYYNGNSIELEVQRSLARNGYYRGPIDGDIGYGTRSAIRAYQLDYGLAPTSYINRELLVSLRLR